MANFLDERVSNIKYLISLGMNNQQIAEELNCTISLVNAIRSSINSIKIQEQSGDNKQLLQE